MTDNSMSIYDYLAAHLAAEESLANLIGGTPQSAARPPVAVAGRLYDALPVFLVDSWLLRSRCEDAAGLHGDCSDGELRVALRSVAELFLTRQGTAQLLEDNTSRKAMKSATATLLAVVDRMHEKGVI